jgi:hypothetical protein
LVYTDFSKAPRKRSFLFCKKIKVRIAALLYGNILLLKFFDEFFQLIKATVRIYGNIFVFLVDDIVFLHSFFFHLSNKLYYEISKKATAVNL